MDTSVSSNAMSPNEKRMAKQRAKLATESKGASKVAKPTVKTVAVKSPKEAKRKVKPKAVETGSGDIELKALCSDLGLDPKTARRKLRNAKLSFHSDRDRWTFTKEQAQEVKDLLSGK